MRKPKKPYPDFPLYPHASGHWAKTILRKTRYFGRFEDGWQAALDRFVAERDALYAGHEPRQDQNGLTVAVALDRFMSSKKKLLKSGELKQRTVNDYRTACRLIADEFGSHRSVESLRPADFDDLRATLASRFGPTRLKNFVTYCRMVFGHINETEDLARDIKFGKAFRGPSKRALRLADEQTKTEIFTAKEIRTLAKASSVPLRAMTWLGINCGFEPHDCGQLRLEDVDLDKGWHYMPRPKTGIPRRCPLWPETIAALRSALERRREPKSTEHGELFFVTKYGNSWYKDKPDNPIGKEFRKVLDSTKIYRPGKTFLLLRATFETIGGETTDQVAVNHIMGHSDQSMAAIYRRGLSDARLERVSTFVRNWIRGKRRIKIG